MIRYAFITSALKFGLSVWAIIEVTRVLVRIVKVHGRNAVNMHVFWVYLVVHGLVVSGCITGLWYGIERAKIVFLCDPAMPVLGTLVATGLNIMHCVAALGAGLAARKVRLDRGYQDMRLILVACASAMLLVVAIGGTILRQLATCGVPGVL